MKKRIYKSMLLLATITIFLTSLFITGMIYRAFYGRMQQEIRNEALFLSSGYNLSGAVVFSEMMDQENSSRITWVASDGTVLYDNAAEAKTMENHRLRPEIADALENGFGESFHLSNTLGTQTFYRAVLLEDGTILRVSTTIHSVYSSVLSFVPYIALIILPVILISVVIANLLTKKIIVPLNNLNLEDPSANNVYDELSPLLYRMAKQNDQIEHQFKKLKKKQEEFKAITENTKEGIIVLNSKGQILSINKSAARIFGFGSENNVGEHIVTLNRSTSLQTSVEMAMEGQSYEAIFTKGKNIFHLLASPVIDNKPISGVVLFLMDITEKQAAERMRREFSANVSHELKTPLTSILGYAELMKNGMVKPEDIVLSAGRIYNEARHLIRLVEDIIRVSRLDEKDVPLPFEEIDLLKLVNEVIARLTPKAVQKQIEISISGEKTVLYGVKQILEEIIYNLCDNAIKYNVTNGKVDISIKKTLSNIILVVEDTGIGIPKEHQDRVFERFYRIDKSHSRDTGGTGLGLSIVKHSAEFHNAKIQLMSEPGKGTKIMVLFNITENQRKK